MSNVWGGGRGGHCGSGGAGVAEGRRDGRAGSVVVMTDAFGESDEAGMLVLPVSARRRREMGDG
jgi:hypothetical protein